MSITDPPTNDVAPAAWVVRDGGRFDYNIEHGVAAIDYNSASHTDLRNVASHDGVKNMLRAARLDAGDGSLSTKAGVLWRFCTEPGVGDLVLMPRKGTQELALGTITKTYWYEDDASVTSFFHRIAVDWQRKDLPRSALGDDLRASLGANMTFFSLAKNDGPRRLQQLMETGEDPGPQAEVATDQGALTALGLDKLAEELLVDSSFLDDIVALLKDKRQVILYGPPGTGKTYLARKLAKTLAPDEACRALVQFHPSTSYEDFFEGYRPTRTGNDGSIRYELTPGPLARMAGRASKAADQQHVMIIDEINRGNLPRVLGELLFLLEYRDESVQTLYRPKETFSLPGNLWFIGTMNTADRSIALVDAALRRRFHFVPFFPDRKPMAGLLGRWLKREQEPTWVGDLVDKVNAELADVLEGSHLLFGPSHFMKHYGSSLDTQRKQLRRVWEYNIEPFIEDQFFDDPNRIARFRFREVIKRHAAHLAEPDTGAGNDSDDPEGVNGSEGGHAATDGDAAPEPDSKQPEDER